MQKKQTYITTPLYYVNDEPHIGHAYTTILSDVLTRYRRLFGEDVYFLTGLDEHGQKVFDAALKAGITPQEHCDKMAQSYLTVWNQLNIQYDDFIRTTEERHEKVVTDILTKLYQKGDIYKKEYEGWYSVYEERFFTEKDLIDGKDPIGGREVEKLKESNYFFRMSKYQDWLIEHYESNPEAVLPNTRLNEVKGFLRQPLQDLCITRPKSRLSWGIPIPWDDEYVTYVWFDALFNYYSATVTPPEGKQVEWPADLHIIGKDILTTHAIYWPTFLQAAGLPQPKQIVAHGWWLAGNKLKMGKSANNAVKPLDLAEIYGTDVFRYVLMREMVLGQDADFSEDMFVQRLNTDLANDLGNLYSRLAKLWKSAGYSPSPLLTSVPELIPADILELKEHLSENVQSSIEELKPHLAIEQISQVVRGLNRLLEQLKPWKIIKSDPDSIKDAMVWCFEALSLVARLLEPVMPSKMQELQKCISDENGGIDPSVGVQLFPRIDAKKAAKPDPAASSGENGKPLIGIEDFTKIDLRTGVIVEAKPVRKADKLLKLQIDLGTEKRQIIAGIAELYPPESLIGKEVVIVANLKPAKLRGELSQGMILAVGDKQVISIVTIDKTAPPGSTVR